MSTHHLSAGQQPATVTTRSERVAQRSAGQGFFANVAAFLKSDHRGKFIVLMFFTSIALSCVIGAWNDPFRFRVHRVTDRAIVCNTPFSVFSPEQKQIEIDRARSTSPHVFANDAQLLVQLREALVWNTITGLIVANSYDELDEQGKLTWAEFLQPAGQESSPEDTDVQTVFADFVTYFRDDTNFSNFQSGLSRAFNPFEHHGVLVRLPFGPERGSQDRILVYRKQEHTPDQAVEYRTSDVLIRDGTAFKDALQRTLGNQRLRNYLLYELIFNWIHPKIPETLAEDLHATAKVEEAAAGKVGDVMVEYAQGQLLVSVGTVLQQGDINLLFAEYKASLHNRTKTKQFKRFVAVTGVLFLTLAIMVCLVFRIERRRPHTSQAFFYLMLGMIAAVAAAQYVQSSLANYVEWEILPLMLFVMFISIVYSWELATILSIFLTITIVCGKGGNIE